MSRRKMMLDEEDVRARAKTRFERNWRNWACELFERGRCEAQMSVPLHPPRERDFEEPGMSLAARGWADAWRAHAWQSDVQWERRSWARVGDQAVPVRVVMCSADDIARWAGSAELWQRAVRRVGDVSQLVEDWAWAPGAGVAQQAPFATERSAVADAVRESIGSWCALGEEDWRMAQAVWRWLLRHPHDKLYVRQLPIRGIHSKWVETHGKALRPLFRALAGTDFEFLRAPHLFTSKACSPELSMRGCSEFALSAEQLARLELRPRALVVCENLANVLSLGEGAARLDGVLAVHGGGFAVTELARVGWLGGTPLLYWGDLDTNGFAILDALRSFAPHARSVLMDAKTLERHMDLCVEEPSPARIRPKRLTGPELDVLARLQAGDPARDIATLRLEQERIEWSWALDRIQEALDAELGKR